MCLRSLPPDSSMEGPLSRLDPHEACATLQPSVVRAPGDAGSHRPAGPSMGLVVSLACAAIFLSACGGGGSVTAPLPARSLAALEPVPAGGLVPKVQELLRSRQAARAANPAVRFDRFAIASQGLSTLAGAPAQASAATTSVLSGTNVQEAGVDEADLLKTDGRMLFAMDGYTLADAQGRVRPQVRVARAGASGLVEPVGTLALDLGGEPANPKGLLLSEKASRLVALATTPSWGRTCAPGLWCGMPTIAAADPTVYLQVAEVSANGSLSTVRRLAFDGQLVASRRAGDVVYLVTTWSPNLAYEALPASASDKEREAALLALQAGDVLPGVRVDGGTRQPLVKDSDCLVQPKASSLALTVTTMVAIDLASPALETRARCLFGGTEGLYMSPTNLYLATTRSPQPITGADGRSVFPAEFSTDLHKFSFAGLNLSYRASGEVKGHLGWDPERIALRMSEHAGDLRVISYTGARGWVVGLDAFVVGSGPSAAQPSAEASPATLSVLREDTARAVLQTIGSLPNTQRPAALGKTGEQIYGVRFSGETGYLVTFRRTDPLYVLDLKDPSDPKIAGALEVPGFSDVLLPLPQGLLLGIGRDADSTGAVGGPKVSLFDVREPTRPALIASRTLGARGSASAVDYSSHGINSLLLGTAARMALPVSLTSSDWAAQAQHTLKRFEVDFATRSLVWRPDLAAPAGTDAFDVSSDRSVQIGNSVFFLSQGRVVGGPW